MIDVIQSETFRKWLNGLRDRQARAFITARLLRLANGLMGDTSSLGDGVSELRIHFGPGYRLYFVQSGVSLIFLLCGGDKSSQARDIRHARQLAQQWRKT